jgi:DNA-binding CsgD family transcriptional regulator
LLIQRLLSHGAPKTEREPCDGEEVIMDAVLDGDVYLLIRMPRSKQSPVNLSPREQEIVRMVAQGHSNKIIADVLNISSWTVCTHLRRIFAKLGVGSRAAMVARLLEQDSIRNRARLRDESLGGRSDSARGARSFTAAREADPKPAISRCDSLPRRAG